MEHKETLKGRSATDLLLYNEDYFKYIFKKTEKIVAAVFYTTRSINDINTTDAVVVFLEDKARALLETAERTLRVPENAQKVRIDDLRVALIGLESALTVGNGARVVSSDLLEVFKHELNSVHRALKEYSKERLANPLYDIGEMLEGERTRRRIFPAQSLTSPFTQGASRNQSGQSGVGGVAVPSRRDRILAIIKDKGQASIKDVTSVIPECSEKTVQRELMSLISEGQIVKQGERRWSKYSIRA